MDRMQELYYIYIYIVAAMLMMGHTMKDTFNDHKKVMFIIKYLRSPQEVGYIAIL